MAVEDGADVAALVAGYADHLEDGEYVRRIFASGDVAIRVLADMLGSGDRERAPGAALVLRDAVLSRFVPGLRGLLPTTSVFAALGANLYAPDYSIRRDSIYTLGKLTYPRQAAALVCAFPVYRERHPLELPDLLGELFWLSAKERRRRWDYLHALSRSPYYAVRWSVFEVAHGWAGMARHSRDARLYKRLLRRLAQDPHPFVRGEARSRLDGARRHPAGPLWPGTLETVVERSFFSVAIQFGNYLWASGRADYDLALLGQFANYVLFQAPRTEWTPPFEWEAFARPFDAWAATANSR